MRQTIFNYLNEKGIIESIKSDYGTISLKTSDNDITIAGNRIELIMLADYILNVALADFDGWHVHLDEHNFFDKESKELIVALKLANNGEASVVEMPDD